MRAEAFFRWHWQRAPACLAVIWQRAVCVSCILCSLTTLGMILGDDAEHGCVGARRV